MVTLSWSKTTNKLYEGRCVRMSDTAIYIYTNFINTINKLQIEMLQ